ncbi:hypothetical protein CASFOL_038651 [Castilleja foliolosa]|uniref:Ubiquitin-like protease family profile domain-containing protein n=1 Tax=Castilleja foliolosa TaxID=1961234 RepID=A0ABD3BLK7_9LAMI
MEILKQQNAARDQMMEQLKIQLEFFQNKWKDAHGEEPQVRESSPQSDNGRCSGTHSPQIEEQILTERWEKCSLFWLDLRSKVAEGWVAVPPQGKATMLHCQPLKLDIVKVLVDDPLMPNVGLPFPTEEVNFVFEAKSSPVAWPKALVVAISAREKKSKGTISSSRKEKHMDNDSYRPPQHVGSLEKYRRTCPSFPSNFLITLDVGEDVFNFQHQLHIGKEQIHTWIQKNALDDIHVSVYMKYLNESLSSSLYGFMCPTYLAEGYNGPEEEKARYMANCMSKPQRKNCVWFAAYKDGLHWTLAVINPWDNIVYLLDPLRKRVPANKFKDMVHAAIAIFFAQQNRNNRRKTHWMNIYQCPKQEINAPDSGYYVCRYMREIIDHKCTAIPVNYFRDSPTFYDIHSIDELREEWLQYIDPK